MRQDNAPKLIFPAELRAGNPKPARKGHSEGYGCFTILKEFVVRVVVSYSCDKHIANAKHRGNMAAVTTLPVTAEDCRCVYVDKRLSEELAGVDLENTGSGGFRDAAVRFGGNGNDITSKIDRQIDELKCNIRALLNAFKQSKLPAPRIAA